MSKTGVCVLKLKYELPSTLEHKKLPSFSIVTLLKSLIMF